MADNHYRCDRCGAATFTGRCAWCDTARDMTNLLASCAPATASEGATEPDHEFLPVNGHPDDDECTHRADGTDATYCGKTRAEHDEPEHHPNCYQSTGEIPADLPDDLCDCRVLRMIDAATGVTSSDGYKVSMDVATGDISVSQWTPASSDGERGLSGEERRSLGCQCWRLDGVWHHVRGCPAPAVERILAARTAQPEGVERVECDHPGIEHGPFSATGICPKCRHCKFIGHGPLCVDCFAPVSAEEVVGDE